MLKRSRIAVMVILVFSIIACYIFQLMQYQVSQGDSYRQQSSKSTINTTPIIAPRGEILDRYGRVLATSTISYNVLIESAFFPSSAQKQMQDEEFLTLAAILAQDKETFDDSLPISASAPYSYIGTKRETAALIKYVNSQKLKKDPLLSSSASAAEVMTALKKIYKTDGYTEAEQRTLCAIRYSMFVKEYSYTKVFILAQGVGTDTVTKIEERSSSLPGAVTQQVPVRSYPNGTIAPHIIGLTGRINASELAANKKNGYTAEDSIGKFGIEKSMESYLRGANGTQQVEQNSNGDVTSSPTIITQPKPGDNVVLTIDDDLQATMQQQLPIVINQIKTDAVQHNQPGAYAQGAAAVVLNIKTGEVLAMATYPSFDLNAYKKNYSALATNSLKPLFNRCIQGTYTPGSTFKPIVAVSGLMNGVISGDTSWDIPETLTVGTGSTAWTGHDDDHNSYNGIDVVKALSVSSNIFFIKLGLGLGINKIDTTASIFGIGKKTGIELPSESAGILSSIAEKKAKGLPWYPADVAQTSFGQLDTLATPLQLANYVSTLVKGGTEYQVHIVKRVTSYDNSKVIIDNSTPTVVSKTAIPSSVTDIVKQGMLSVTESGTAASIFSTFAMKIGGKTGTAQINLNDGYNGVFISFAPYDDPEIAIATVVEYGHNGFQTAPAAKEAIQQYFNLDANGNSNVTTTSTTSVGTLLQ